MPLPPHVPCPLVFRDFTMAHTHTLPQIWERVCALSRALGVVSSWRYQIPLGLTLSTCLFLFLSSRWTCVLVQKCDLDTLNRLSSSAPAETVNSISEPPCFDLPKGPAGGPASQDCREEYEPNSVLPCSQRRLVSYSPISLRSANICTLPVPGTCHVRVHRRFPALKVLLGVRKQNKESGNKQQDNYYTSSAMEEINSKMMNSWRQPRNWVRLGGAGDSVERMLTTAYLLIKS